MGNERVDKKRKRERRERWKFPFSLLLIITPPFSPTLFSIKVYQAGQELSLPSTQRPFGIEHGEQLERHVTLKKFKEIYYLN